MPVEERKDSSNKDLDQKTEKSILDPQKNLNIEEQPRNSKV